MPPLLQSDHKFRNPDPTFWAKFLGAGYPAGGGVFARRIFKLAPAGTVFLEAGALGGAARRGR